MFRRDARAGLVGVRPRRGAVEDLPRGRRRFRPGRLRRPLGPDLLTGLAVAPLAPVDFLAGHGAVLGCSTGAREF